MLRRSLGVIIWVLYYYIRFLSYDKYKEYLSDYEYEEGGEYSAISEKDPRVPGMELVAENDYLKLYTDPKTAIIAVYDKRNHSIVYSNPLNADDDPIANEANKRYLKSQFISIILIRAGLREYMIPIACQWREVRLSQKVSKMEFDISMMSVTIARQQQELYLSTSP